jgi:hypothetical protein
VDSSFKSTPCYTCSRTDELASGTTTRPVSSIAAAAVTYGTGTRASNKEPDKRKTQIAADRREQGGGFGGGGKGGKGTDGIQSGKRVTHRLQKGWSTYLATTERSSPLYRYLFSVSTPCAPMNPIAARSGAGGAWARLEGGAKRARGGGGERILMPRVVVYSSRDKRPCECGPRVFLSTRLENRPNVCSLATCPIFQTSASLPWHLPCIVATRMRYKLVARHFSRVNKFDAHFVEIH